MTGELRGIKFPPGSLSAERVIPLLQRFIVPMILFLSTLCLSSLAADLTGEFDAANKLYEQNKFSEAASSYDKLIKSGERSAAVYFNLGNALLKAGYIGRAIVAYHQAEQITPRDPDIRANLEFARKQMQGPALAPGRWKQWLGRLTLNEWTLLACAALWLWFLVMIGMQWRPVLRRSLRSYAFILGAAFLLASVCLGAAVHAARYEAIVVVTVRDADIRNGPLEESQTSFTVHDGAELRLLDEKAGWLQVGADAHRVGWVRSESVTRVP